MKYTNVHNLPPFIQSALTKDYYDSGHNTLSMTNLISSPRYSLLLKRHNEEIEEDLSDQIWKIFGSAIHVIFDQAAMDAGIEEKEERILAEVDGITISGKFDILHNKIISDYKVTSVWQMIFNDQVKWTQQLNGYAWLLMQQGREVEALQIICIFRDWRRGEAEKSKLNGKDDYPQIPIQIVPIPLWDKVELDTWIKGRVKLYKESMNLPDDELPICTPEDRWKTEDTFAIYKNENKTATRVLSDIHSANAYLEGISAQYSKDKFSIHIRPGEDKRCKNYCPSKKFCSYWKAKYGGENEHM